MSRFVHDSTTHFQGPNFSSHKPYSPHQRSLATTSIQKKFLIQQQKIPSKKLMNDLNSPEGAGLTNPDAVRPAGSPDSNYCNFYNTSSSKITTKLILQNYNYNFLKSFGSHKLEGNDSEMAKNRLLMQIWDDHSSGSEGFRAFKTLIKIPSVMIDIHQEDDQQHFISEQYKGSQINYNQWHGVLSYVKV
jgi:hypothetical protein